MRLAVLMPVFDEGPRLAETLRELAERARAERARVTVFVVDDGSREPAHVCEPGLDLVLARHAVNLGQGAALETARRLALEESARERFDAFVTMDADGQHRAEDVFAVARAVLQGADVALGDRFAGGSRLPPGRAALLRLARAFERALTGLALADAHNGLRAFDEAALARVPLRQNRMAHATELTQRIARARLRVAEVPIVVRYSPDVTRKGQRASGALTIVVDLFSGFLFGEERP